MLKKKSRHLEKMFKFPVPPADKRKGAMNRRAAGPP
jgi:hypothetical protein